MDISIPQSRFSTGEISPELKHRYDIPLYQTGASEVSNFDITRAGSLRKRSGLKYIDTLGSIRNLHSYQPSDVSNYLFVIEDTNLVIRDGVTGNIVDQHVHGLAGSLEDVEFVHVEDVTYMFSTQNAPRKLTRVSATQFSYTTPDIIHPATGKGVPGATIDINSITQVTPTTLQLGLAIGTVTPVDLVGKQIIIRQNYTDANKRQALTLFPSTGVFTGTPMDVSVGREVSVVTAGRWSGEATVEESLDGGTTWTKIVSKTSNNASANFTVNIPASSTRRLLRTGYVDDGVAVSQESGTITLEQEGVFFESILEVLDNTGLVKVITPLQNLDLPQDFEFSDWGGNAGYPSVGTIHDRRLVLSGASSFSSQVWMSSLNLFENFYSPTVEATDPVNFSIQGEVYSAVQWLLSRGSNLFIGAGGSEWQVTGINGKVITPSELTVQKLSTIGSTKEPGALLLGDSMIFFHSSGRKLIEYVFSDATQSYDSIDLNSLSSHLFNLNPVKVAETGSNPVDKLHCVKADGSMSTLTFAKSDQVVGWTNFKTDGEILEVSVVPGRGEIADILWLAVNRNGTITLEVIGTETDTVFYQEDHDSYRYMDSYVEQQAVEGDVITIPAHLQNKDLQVYVDGVIQVGVKTGIEYVTAVPGLHTIGLPYKAVYKSLPVSIQTERGVTAGAHKVNKELHVLIYKSALFNIYSDDKDQKFMNLNIDNSNSDGKVSIYSGWVSKTLTSSTTKDDGFTIESEEPTPLQINGTNLRIDIRPH